MVNKDEETKTYCVICSFDNKRKTITFHNVMILIKSVFSKDKFDYIYIIRKRVI